MAQKINLENLKLEIRRKGISLGEVSEKTGISRPMLSMMFKGKRNMTVSKLNAILDACEISLKDIE